MASGRKETTNDCNGQAVGEPGDYLAALFGPVQFAC